MQTIAPLPNRAPQNLRGAPLLALRRRWLLVAAVYTAGLLAGWALLRVLDAAAWLWLLPAAGLLGLQLAVFWWALPANHPAESPALWPTLGIANWMTLMRGLLVGLLAGFIFIPLPPGAWAWLPALLYSSERLLDFVDGYVARVTGRASRLGSILDMEFDGLGILVAVAVTVQMGKLPVWYLLLGVARPLFVMGIYLRRRWALPVHDLPPSSQRRLVAGVQTAFVSVMLWPPLPVALTHLAGALFALPLAASFVRDWLVVSGRLNAAGSRYQRVHSRAALLLEGWLPVAARPLGAGAALWLAAPDFTRWGAPGAYAGPALALLAGAAAILLLLGAAARVAGLLLLVLVMLEATTAGMSAAVVVLLICTTWVLHTGPGHMALWQPEERLFRTALGAPANHVEHSA